MYFINLRNMKLILLCLIVLIFSCKQEKTEKSIENIDSSISRDITFSIPDISEESLHELFELQLRVNKNPTKLAYRKQLVEKSHFQENNALITFGCARMTHPVTGQKVAQALLKRAAIIDAKRWAAYGQTWILNNYMPDFGKLNSTFNGINQQIISFNRGDSLVIAFAHKLN